jgi:molecular chaperone GrpE
MIDDAEGPEQKQQPSSGANREDAVKDKRGAAAPDETLGAGEPAEELAAQLATEVETLKGQVADLTDRLLRAHAEMENFRKRTEREREETAKYAITRFARDVLAIGDNLQRATGSVPVEASDEHESLKALLEGVSMTEREFLNVLERHGVRRIEPQGEPFNPHQHQAMMEVQNPDVAAGTVMQVFQPGYVIEDRVLRPAMVVVAKGGAKPGRSSDSGNGGPAQPKPAS